MITDELLNKWSKESNEKRKQKAKQIADVRRQLRLLKKKVKGKNV